MSTLKKPLYSGTKFKVGKKFDKLTIKEHLGNRKAICLCDCGNLTTVLLSNIGRKNTTSCGCVWKNKINSPRKHGHSMADSISPTYRTWVNMKTRCNNSNSDKYKWYGKRGIKVCEKWSNFSGFLEDMGIRPSSLHSLDRINNEGDYCLQNCRWSTMKEQSNNRRTRVDSVPYINCLICKKKFKRKKITSKFCSRECASANLRKKGI